MEYERQIPTDQTGSAETWLERHKARDAVAQATVALKREGRAGSIGETEKPRWQDRGIQDVRLAYLPDVQEITGPQDFHKVSMSEMQNGLRKVQEMKEAVESGEGDSSDFWARYDQEHGLEYSQGYQRVYDAFYGQDAIRVEKDGNTYNIINGRHRIWLARRLGISSLPMRVIER